MFFPIIILILSLYFSYSIGEFLAGMGLFSVAFREDCANSYYVIPVEKCSDTMTRITLYVTYASPIWNKVSVVCYSNCTCVGM